MPMPSVMCCRSTRKNPTACTPSCSNSKPREAVNQAIESFATAIGMYRVNNDNLVEQYRESLFEWHKKAIEFEEYKRCSSVALRLSGQRNPDGLAIFFVKTPGKETVS